jgi:RecB family exonuclease
MAPRDLRSPFVLGELGKRELFGASTLEEYETCSYRWFVGHELRPRRLDPTDEPLVLGGLAHKVLELLFRERPGDTPRPTPGNLEQWRDRARELVDEQARDSDLPASDPVASAQLHRVKGLISAHLADEAASERVLVPDRELLEAAFGDDEGDQRGSLELDGLRLHGKIDRVDVAELPGGRIGLISDYKLSSSVTPAARLSEEGKLQLQLYSLALRELWGIEPLGGMYLPLRATTTAKRRPRGVMDGEHADALAGFDTFGNDRLPHDGFEEALASAAATASRIAGDVHDGRLRRDPLGGECPRFCRFQTICRRERGMREDEDPLEEEDE